ncbi:hypothetical protein ACFWTE_17750 [Nocardiopsis sp. NPDC058631]|uniref:hypothetical protein n=1 Tax=Nocardiopsis sp. NPDC058631 TaxID=3346566 RepID=UPI003654F7C6
MEAIGVPWFIAVRYLGPPLLLLLVGGALLVWRPPARRGLVWAALVTNLVAAALPFLWIGLQIVTDQAERTVFGLVMTLFQPLVVVVAWLLVLTALIHRPPAVAEAVPAAAVERATAVRTEGPKTRTPTGERPQAVAGTRAGARRGRPKT